MKTLHQSCRTGDEPTFWEFVQYVIRRPTGDEHWTPISRLCSPCHINYKYIIKFEQMRQEEAMMMEMMGLGRKLSQTINVNMNKHRSRDEGTRYVVKYLNMLTEKDWEQLLEVYKEDVEMFMYKEDLETLKQTLSFQ